MAVIFTSSALRRAVASRVCWLASALARAATALASAARRLAASSWYSGCPCLTMPPSVNRRFCTMPLTCGRTSALRKAWVRPGSTVSSIWLCFCSTTTPTLAGAFCAAGLSVVLPHAATSTTASAAAAMRHLPCGRWCPGEKQSGEREAAHEGTGESVMERQSVERNGAILGPQC